MLVYRLCSAKYTALDGEGSRLFGGRWNSPGRAVIYTATSVALAILETRVHLTAMPRDYILLTIEIGDEFSRVSFPKHPREIELPMTRSVGDNHFESRELLPLMVPSVVSHGDSNMLFSAAYARLQAITLSADPIWFDPRLWSHTSSERQ